MSSKFRLKPHNLLDLVSFTHAEKTSPAGDQHTVCFGYWYPNQMPSLGVSQ